MRSKIAAVLMGGAFLLAGAPVALAKSEQHWFSGDVTHLDTAAKTLAVTQGSGKTTKEMTFKLSPEAKIMEGTRTRTLAELKVGERVSVTYADEGSTHEAQRVQVLSAKTAKADPSKTSTTKPKSSY